MKFTMPDEATLDSIPDEAHSLDDLHQHNALAKALGVDPNTKPSNPKDAIGVKKAPLSVVSLPVLMEVGLGMAEGALKYGAHNYREIGVRSSVYFDATIRHLFAWWEGEDTDPESGANLSHISKAIASLTVLRDAMIQGKLDDDRPPASPLGWLDHLNKGMAVLAAKFPKPVARYLDGHRRGPGRILDGDAK